IFLPLGPALEQVQAEGEQLRIDKLNAQNEGGRPSGGAVGTLGSIGDVVDFDNLGPAFGPLTEDEMGTMAEDLGALIVRAKELKTQLDNATDPKEWIRVNE